MNVKSSLQSKVKEIVLISLYASLICVFTILIPQIVISGIPFTLQTLIIITIANIAKPRVTFLSVLLYLAIGIIGLPVFSGLKGGLGVILGPTGGFLIAFPFASLFISKLIKQKFLYNILINIIFGILFIYLLGVSQFSIVNEITFLKGLKGMLLFIPIDTVKIIIATLIGIRVKKTIN
ncbi:MAG TPA: biotin transporter BioY [Acholeplasmataceae bacterium]|nr:biotin transporter BioY [Acholeplasmataceae bacterium]